MCLDNFSYPDFFLLHREFFFFLGLDNDPVLGRAEVGHAETWLEGFLDKGHELGLYVYICICIYMYMYIYIYIWRKMS